MTWEYIQNTGDLLHDGKLYAQGYSGKDGGKNNALMENIRNIGSIPRGYYRISGYNDHKGPWTIVLEPVLETNTFGRSAFRIHGDNVRTPGRSSEGCIIINGAHLRKNIFTSGDVILVVR